MATLESRVEALEHAGGSGLDFILILRRFITPGMPPSEATHGMLLGQHFERAPAESEAAFIERLRAYAVAHRRPGQFGAEVLMDETDLAI